MRPISKNGYTQNNSTYDPYGSAKDDLIEALGPFCSYCERAGYFSALDVEHIRDKDSHTERKLLWRNFLIGCKNCNPIKSTKSVLGMFFPTIDDTYNIFIYDKHGKVAVNRAYLNNQDDIDKATKLLDLVGLDRLPGHPNYSTKDRRWQERKTVWGLADRYLSRYQNGEVSEEVVLEFALAKGFWSIWMTVFHGHQRVIQKLIDGFPGTRY